LNRQHEIGQPHGPSRYGHCHRIGFLQKNYIWKLIMSIMSKWFDKKYRGTQKIT
jgi:hypothetical protein